MQAKALVNVPVFLDYRGDKNGKSIAAGTVFPYLVKRDTWLQLTSGAWVSCGTNYQYIQLISVVTPPPPPPPTIHAKHVILIDEFGRMSVDGLPYE